jgi:hypothetical protein
MIVPDPAGEAAAPSVDPELRARVVRALGLKRLAATAGLMLAGVLVGGGFLLDAWARREATAPPPPPAPLTLETLPGLNPSLPFPVSRGRAWTYELTGGGREERRVGMMGGGPTADVAVSGSSDAGSRSYRLDREGTWLLEERRGGIRWTFEQPVCWIPHPLYAEDRWKVSGTAANGRGGTETWRIDAAVGKTERVEVPAGTFACYRIDYKGMKGARPVEETWWVAKGTGLVKRRSTTDGRVEEARLLKVAD